MEVTVTLTVEDCDIVSVAKKRGQTEQEYIQAVIDRQCEALEYQQAKLASRLPHPSTPEAKAKIKALAKQYRDKVNKV